MDRDDELILSAAAMFHAAAMQQMGKLVHPVSGKVEKDLEGARFSIDVLGALERKTRDTLSPEAAKQLEHFGFELRMNYLDETRKPADEGESPEAASAGESSRDEPPDAAASESSRDEPAP